MCIEAKADQALREENSLYKDQISILLEQVSLLQTQVWSLLDLNERILIMMEEMNRAIHSEAPNSSEEYVTTPEY